MCLKEFGICNCDCHENENIKHITACCKTCALVCDSKDLDLNNFRKLVKT